MHLNLYCLRQWRVAHPKPRPHVFGDEFDRRTIGQRITLGKIAHRFYQQALAFDVARIGRSFSLGGTTQLGRDGNRKNFGQYDLE
ncbi:MAG: hypothetical protein WA824_03665 [Candidatus Sulfotelmatobacter sp.]